MGEQTFGMTVVIDWNPFWGISSNTHRWQVGKISLMIQLMEEIRLGG